MKNLWTLLLLFSVTAPLYLKSQNCSGMRDMAIISGEVNEDMAKVDSVYLDFFDNYISGLEGILPIRSFSSPVVEGKFTISIKSILKPGYFNLSFGKLNGTLNLNNFFSLHNMLVEPGDSIFIQNRRIKGQPYWGFACSGKGAHKYSCQLHIDRITDAMLLLTNKDFQIRSLGIPKDPVELTMSNFMKYDSIYKQQMEVLNFYQDKLSPFIYDTFYANLMGENGTRKMNDLIGTIKYFLPKRTKIVDSNVVDLYNSVISQWNLLDSFPQSIKTYSYGYSDFLYSKLYLLDKVGLATENTLIDSIQNVKDELVRDKLFFKYFASKLSENYTADISNDTSKISMMMNGPLKTTLLNIEANLTPENLAFDFNLPDKYGRHISLSEFKGKVVLLDFWYTGCGGCANYYTEVLKQTEEHYRNNNQVIFVTISIDPKPKTWIKSIESGLYTSELAINLYTDGLGLNHPIIRHYGVRAFPRPILIGKNGKIINTSNTDLRQKGSSHLISIIEKAKVM